MAGRKDIVEQALKLITGAGGEEAAQTGIRAYHGSPHDFDRFDISKIGTGEGAQAYGHGLYFAGNEGIARHYRDALSSNKFRYEDVQPDDEALKKFANQLADVETRQKNLSDPEGFISLDNNYGELENLQSEKDKIRNMMIMDTVNRNPHLQYGRMYEVNIAADPNTFLDWDKPLSEQPEAIKKLFPSVEEAKSLDAQMDKLSADVLANPDDKALQVAWDEAYRNPRQKMARMVLNDFNPKLGGKFSSGNQLYSAIASKPSEASSFLKEAGIPGIKYLDAGSRVPSAMAKKELAEWQAQLPIAEKELADAVARGDSWLVARKQDEVQRVKNGIAAASKEAEGTRNYVVFDDRLISIIRKYGIAGASAMLGYNLMETLDANQAQAAIGADKEYKSTQPENKGGMLPAGMEPSGEMTSRIPSASDRIYDYVMSVLGGDEGTKAQRAQTVMNVIDQTPLAVGPMAYDAARGITEKLAYAQGGTVRKGYATDGSVQPGPVFMEDAKGNKYDMAGNIVPPAQDPVTDALSVARREVVDPYAEEIASAKKLMADKAYQEQSWGDWASNVGKNLYNTGMAFLPTALGGQGAVGLTDIAKGAYESAKSGATLPGDVLTGKTNVFDPTSGDLTDEVLRRGADFTGFVTLGAGAIPAEANTLRMGIKGPSVPDDPEAAALKAAHEATGEDQPALAAKTARQQLVDDQMEAMQPPSMPANVSPDAPTKAFVQVGKPIPPSAPPFDPALVQQAQADTRMGADIVKRRLPVIVPEQERVVGGVYTPGMPDGRRWSELTPQELSVRGKGAGFTNDDLQNIWNQTLSEVSEAGRQAVANTGATWKAFPAEKWDKALKLPLRSQLWYELSGEAFVDRLPDLKYNEHMMFLDLVGATSARARPGENLERALAVLSQRLRGVPIDVDLTTPSTVSAALRRDGKNVSSDLANKTGMFSDTLALTGGLPTRYPISVNDVWVGNAFGITDDQLSANQALHEVFGKYTNKLRDLVNKTSPSPYPHQSWNLQSRQWVELRAAKEKIDTSIGSTVEGSDYAGEWEKVLSKLKNAGIDVPNDKITRDILMDPRFADALRSTTPEFRAAPKATIEFGTLLTPNGQKAADIYNRARQLGDQKTQDEYLAALTTSMYHTARGDLTIWDKTVRSALGEAVDVSRIYSPKQEDPFAISGTFGGAAAPNIRVPLRGLTPDQVAYFNAVAGKGLRQKAMAAVEINRLEAGQPVPEGAVPSHAVRFEYDGPIPQKMLTDFAAALGEGFEVSAMRYPDSMVVDINPRFGDAGPEPADPQAIASAIKLLEDQYGVKNAEAYNIAYKSEYGKNYVEDPGDGSGYRQIINATLKEWEADAVAQLRNITGGKFSDGVLKKYLKGDDEALKSAAAAARTGVSSFAGKANTVRENLRKRLSDHADVTKEWNAIGKEIDQKLGALIPKWERRQSARAKKEEKANKPLPPKQAARNFEAAFGQTYLKDPSGKPMRLYHLTPGNFSEFSISPENRSGPVVFLSPYKDFQPAYHQAAERGPNGELTSTFKEGANVMPVYADVRNPLVLDSNEKIKEAQAKYQGGDRGFPYTVTPEAKAAMEADGYDAIIFGGNNPYPYRTETSTERWKPRLGFQENREEEFIIFDPRKIKSAVSNRGTYDTSNPDITKALGGSIDDEDIDNALRLARAMGGRIGYAEAGSVPVMMEDAKGNKYDAHGNLIPPTTPGPNPARTPTPQEVGQKASMDPATFDALMQQYAVPDRDIAQYEATKAAVAAQPRKIQQMTHVGDRPTRAVKVDMPLFGGEYSVGSAPYDVAGNMSGVAQAAYDFKTAPFYAIPLTAPIAAGMDLAEGIATNDPLTASLAVGFGPGSKYAKAAGIGTINYLMDPSEAEAGPARWFSKAVEAARNVPMNKMTGEQALAMLRKGVSPEELKWIGADRFLPGQESITKQDLIDYLEKNRVGTKDVVFADRSQKYPYKSAEGWQNAISRAERAGNFDEAERLTLAWEEYEGIGGFETPRYKRHSTFGGDDYRETLITLPTSEYGRLFQSGHWEGYPNVIGHIRTQILDVNPPGSNRPYKAFNVDEAQSDYAKEGREIGFSSPELMKKIEDEIRAVQKEREKYQLDLRAEGEKIAALDWEASKQAGSLPPVSDRFARQQWLDDKRAILNNNPDYLEAYSKHKELQQKNDELIRKELELSRNNKGVPYAPYVTNTQNWTDLSIKKALDQAIDAGADYFTYTPGEAQAARYSLRNAVDELHYSPSDSKLYGKKDGRWIFEKKVEPDKLPKYVGSAVSEELLKQPPQASKWYATPRHVLSGQQLELGGEGMIDYYDNIYKKRVEKVVKDATGKKVQWEVIPVQTADGPREQLGFRITDMQDARFSDFNKGGRVTDRAKYADSDTVSRALALTSEV